MVAPEGIQQPVNRDDDVAVDEEAGDERPGLQATDVEGFRPTPASRGPSTRISKRVGSVPGMTELFHGGYPAHALHGAAGCPTTW